MSAAAAKTAYFTFGRFQPPTIGHAVLINTILGLAADTAADAYVFISKSYDATIEPLKKKSATVKNYQNKYRNPIPAENKVAAIREAYAEAPLTVEVVDLVPSIYRLADKGYTHIVMVIGSDRVDGFASLIKSLQGKLSARGITLEIKGVARKANNTSKSLAPHLVSGTKLRTFAIEGNYPSFKAGIMAKENMTAKKLYNAIRNHYNRIKGILPKQNEIKSQSRSNRLSGRTRRISERSPERSPENTHKKLQLNTLSKASPAAHLSPAKSPSATSRSL